MDCLYLYGVLYLYTQVNAWLVTMSITKLLWVHMCIFSHTNVLLYCFQFISGWSQMFPATVLHFIHDCSYIYTQWHRWIINKNKDVEILWQISGLDLILIARHKELITLKQEIVGRQKVTGRREFSTQRDCKVEITKKKKQEAEPPNRFCSGSAGMSILLLWSSSRTLKLWTDAATQHQAHVVPYVNFSQDVLVTSSASSICSFSSGKNGGITYVYGCNWTPPAFFFFHLWEHNICNTLILHLHI